MGKMSEIAMMLENGDEKGLVEFFGKEGWRRPVADIGGKEFIKAFDEINKDKKKKKKYVRISDVNKEIAEEWRKQCPICKSDHPIHTLKDLSDGNCHELKDGSTTVIPDPFKKEEKDD